MIELLVAVFAAHPAAARSAGESGSVSVRSARHVAVERLRVRRAVAGDESDIAATGEFADCAGRRAVGPGLRQCREYRQAACCAGLYTIHRRANSRCRAGCLCDERGSIARVGRDIRARGNPSDTRAARCVESHRQASAFFRSGGVARNHDDCRTAVHSDRISGRRQRGCTGADNTRNDADRPRLRQCDAADGRAQRERRADGYASERGAVARVACLIRDGTDTARRRAAACCDSDSQSIARLVALRILRHNHYLRRRTDRHGVRRRRHCARARVCATGSDADGEAGRRESRRAELNASGACHTCHRQRSEGDRSVNDCAHRAAAAQLTACQRAAGDGCQRRGYRNAGLTHRTAARVTQCHGSRGERRTTACDDAASGVAGKRGESNVRCRHRWWHLCEDGQRARGD